MRQQISTTEPTRSSDYEVKAEKSRRHGIQTLQYAVYSWNHAQGVELSYLSLSFLIQVQPTLYGGGVVVSVKQFNMVQITTESLVEQGKKNK